MMSQVLTVTPDPGYTIDVLSVVGQPTQAQMSACAQPGSPFSRGLPFFCGPGKGVCSMSTSVLYVDEAGNPHKHDVPSQDGQTPLFVLGGIALPLSEWRNIDREYLSLKRQYFTKEMESTKQQRPEHWEAKGSDLTQPRNRSSARRQAFLHEVLNFIERFDAKLFAIVFLKDSKSPTPPTSVYTTAVQQLAERFAVYTAEHPTFEHGIMIMDSRCRGPMGQDFQVGSSYLSYVFGHTTGRQLTTLVEAPLFADSRLTAGLQIADNVTSMLYGNQYHYYLRSMPGAHDYSHLQQYWPRLASLEFHSRSAYDGYVIRGIRRNDFRTVKVTR